MTRNAHAPAADKGDQRHDAPKKPVCAQPRFPEVVPGDSQGYTDCDVTVRTERLTPEV